MLIGLVIVTTSLQHLAPCPLAFARTLGLASGCWPSLWLAGVFAGADLAARDLGSFLASDDNCYASRVGESRRNQWLAVRP